MFLLLVSICDASPLHNLAHLRRRHHHHIAPSVHNATAERRNTVVTYGYGAVVTNNMYYKNNANGNDGPGVAVDSYTYYSGGPESFPDMSRWISYEAMFTANIPLMRQSCGWNNWGPDNTDRQIGWIKNYIQQAARASGVDHRAVLAVIMQEVLQHQPFTVLLQAANFGILVRWMSPLPYYVYQMGRYNGVRNPGLMQSHNGAEFNPAAPVTTIRQMIIDGTMGTAYGDGLVQLLNRYGNYYKAFRGYNSGSIAASGDLSNGNGATPCYVSDIANRLLGWTLAPNACRG
ncbi:hypothetical protein Dda_8340 [Drechslerella dactyloides]|uniref:Transglycosylase SLT domain-containing protein n=1 Tax=Drechslerella dactyloides TaxID=74499 RepID=A0AAD6NH74_DREDA|nr:hypothetical protein Dda_8340 [Drechslerella dactyloides]